MDKRDLWNYHPADHIALERFENIRAAARVLAKAIEDNGENREDKDRAIVKLRECVFYAIASLAIPEVE